ncbi:unnamed protein product [Larinioides sclopetarius]|uniref:WAP domain-containing protein n=1 Tax=Larinioides sclopetarius TaxID=280406 RepID=A0AAV1YUQ7_9ARAC
MKIIFLVALIPTVLICIESYEGAHHMMYYAPVNEGPGAQHMMHYAEINPDQGAQYMMHYAEINPDQGAQHMMHYTEINPDQGAQHMMHYAAINPDQGAQHMMHYAAVNPDQGAQHMMHFAAVNPDQGAQQMMHFAAVNPDQGDQHMMHNEQGKRKRCHHGRDLGNRECLPGPFTYEYYTPEYSAERQSHYESHFWPIRRTFCPRRYSWPCSQKINECCSDYDCDPIQLCCFENCGNTCQFPVSFPTDGVKVQHHDPYCRVDPMFGKIPYPPPIKG